MLSSAFVCSVSTVVAQEFLEPRHLVHDQCPWTTHSGSRNVMKCADGSSCNVWKGGRGNWDCCKKRGGRLQCPPSHPTMCAEGDCGGDDHCCSTGDCSNKGGPRICCSGKSNCRQCLEEGCAFTTGECMEGCMVADAPCWQGDAEEMCTAFDQSQEDAETCSARALQTDCHTCSTTAKSGGDFCQWMGHKCVAAATTENDVQQDCKPRCEEHEVRLDPEDNCCEYHCTGGVFQKQCHGCSCPSHMLHVKDDTCCGQCLERCSGSTCRQCLEEDGCAFTTGKCMEGCMVADVPCWQGDAEEKCAAFDQSQKDAETCSADALQTDCHTCSITAKLGGDFCQWVGNRCVAAADWFESQQPCCEAGVMRDDPDDACCKEQCNDEGVFKTALCSFCRCPRNKVRADDGTCCNCVDRPAPPAPPPTPPAPGGN